MKMKRIYFYILLAILGIFNADSQAQYNSIRIATYTGGLPIPDNFLTRVRDAGYTHVMAGIGNFDPNEWQNGEYHEVSVDSGMVFLLTGAFSSCSLHGLKYIPMLPSANRWLTGWYNTNNPEITYQYYVQDVMEDIAKEDLIDDDGVLRFINFLFDLDEHTFEVSPVPAYAENINGFDKTYKSLIRDVIQYAFNQTGLPQSEFDLINLGNDEPCTYSESVAFEQKLLIGKSQEDLKWMYDSDTSHYGIQIGIAPAVKT